MKVTVMFFWIENGSGFQLQRLSCCEENLVKVQVKVGAGTTTGAFPMMGVI